ncbi:MAG: PAS domain S-box protein [Planctomycetes bacterium]|nr:PAS domain S-box protein [Planctomycetota bacterium]
MLTDSQKTKAQLIEELESLRSRVAAFEQPARGENALQQSDFLQALYAAAPVGLCYLDTELRFVFINEWLADINGLSVEQHVGRRIGEVLPDVAAGVESQFRHVIETGEPILEGMVVAETPAHPEVKRYFQHSYLPVKSNDGTVVGISCVVQDITERKQAEESLRLTQFALDHAADPIYWVREDGRIFYANNAACQSLGYSRDELLSMSVPEIDPDFPTEGWPAHWQEVKKSGRLTFEAHHRTKDGRVFPVEITTNYLTDGPHEFAWAYVQDITERKQAEEALRSSEALYGTILEAAPQIIWQAEADGGCSYINQAWEDILGMPKEEALGFGWATVIHPDDAPGLLAKWERAYAHGESYSGECRFLSKDGSYRTFDFVGLPVRDTSGEIIRWVGINTDITDRKRAEESLRRTELELIHSARLNTLGEMVAGIAHEISQPLFAIMNYVEACSRTATMVKCESDRELVEWIGKIGDSAKQAGDIYPAGELGHFTLLEFLDFSLDFVDGADHEVFKDAFVVHVDEFFVYFHGENFGASAGDDLDHAAAGGNFHFLLCEGFLHFGHFRLHLLRLFEQGSQIFHFNLLFF